MARSGSAENSARRLDAATIIRTGVDLASRAETEAISFRSLGAELGVDPTAIYRHFQSRDALMRALIDDLHLRVLDRLPQAASWDERIINLAEITLEVHIMHPAIAFEAHTLTTSGPGEARTIEYILGAFADAGLDATEVVRHYAVLASFMLSQTAGIARARMREAPEDRMEPRRWLEGPLLVDAGMQPHMAELHFELSGLVDINVFRLGVRSVIESAQRARPPS